MLHHTHSTGTRVPVCLLTGTFNIHKNLTPKLQQLCTTFMHDHRQQTFITDHLHLHEDDTTRSTLSSDHQFIKTCQHADFATSSPMRLCAQRCTLCLHPPQLRRRPRSRLPRVICSRTAPSFNQLLQDAKRLSSTGTFFLPWLLPVLFFYNND